ncbi:PREDICTED: aspartic [Prunus dulcis]|uniref:PREDICTED: aspartic n=1 Tax=Prunus dulcis TaxID=3755 RepID=A0A5E4EAX9_PRUDU|nr:PREDICTED: aspartic [Prunus dulcis]
MLYPNSPQSEIRPENGEYLLKLSIGNPPVDVYGIADTGSDLLWPQCVPCEACFKHIYPKFDPKMSSTCSGLPFAAQECQFIPTSCSLQNLCCYDYEYEDDSVTKGAVDTGHNNTGTLIEIDTGIFGLEEGPISLVSQLGSLLRGRKCYCLAPFHTDPSIESNITSLLGKVVKESFKRQHVPGLRHTNKQHINPPTTYKSTDLYDRLVAELKKQIPMKPVEDDPNLGTQLFYKSKTNLRGPILTVHLEGDANVRLTPTDIHSTKRWGFLLCNDK